MNAGLGHLTELKAHLLAESLRAQTQWDTAIANLGRGVAARFESFCARKFARTEEDTHEFTAERPHVALPRYPVEAITTVELREAGETDFVDQGAVADLVDQLMASSGVALLAAPLGSWRDRGRITYTGGFWWPTSAPVVVASGSAVFNSGQSSAAVAFDSPFDSTPAIKCTCNPPDDEEEVIEAQPYDQSTTGFTIRLAAPAPADDYEVTWIAVLGDDDADPSVIQAGNTSLALNDETKAITFGTAFESAPRVVCNVVAPDGGLIISVSPKSITTSGFTANLGFPIPATGYSLAWVAVAATAASAAQECPDGATALPDDLKLAWLLQCEHVWKKRDVQGVSLATNGEETQKPTLTNLALVPEVKEILRRYVRHALT